jgi:hypothetical protein
MRDAEARIDTYDQLHENEHPAPVWEARIDTYDQLHENEHPAPVW